MAETATAPKPAEKKSPVKEFIGFVGGVFACYAHDDMEFGDPRPKVGAEDSKDVKPASVFRVNGREVKITSWRPACIKGELARDEKPGDCLVEIDGTKFTGKIHK